MKVCEEIPGLSDKHGWSLLKRLPLSRARRRALHASRNWVVSLCCGASSENDPLRSWSQEQNFEYLGVDIRAPGGRGWDLCAESGVWSVLLWAAAQGRIAAVLSSPPHRTWNPRDEGATGRTTEDPWAVASYDAVLLKESILAIQDMLLWSIASIARGFAIPFLKEVSSIFPALRGQDSKICSDSFWHTEAWKSFQTWAKVRTLSFCQGSLGHDWLCPTTIGTNLSLDHLQGIPKARPSQSFQ